MAKGQYIWSWIENNLPEHAVLLVVESNVEEIKYGKLSKEAGNFALFCWCMHVRTFNLNYVFFSVSGSTSACDIFQFHELQFDRANLYFIFDT